MSLAALRGSIALRLLVALFVCLIVADGAMEGHCDSPRTSSATASAIAGDAGAGRSPDACATMCVPDCYCCARGVEPSIVMALPEAEPAGPVPDAVRPAAPEGVRPLPYRPPLPPA